MPRVRAAGTAATPSASGGTSRAALHEQVGQRQVDAVANEPPHAGRIVALPLRIDGQAGPRPASPARHWPAAGSCSPPPRSRGSADRTCGPAWARSGRHSRRRAPRACHRAGGASGRRTGRSSPARRRAASETGCPAGRRRTLRRCIVRWPATPAARSRGWPPGGRAIGLGLLGPRAAAKHDEVANAAAHSRAARRSRCSLRSVSTRGERPSRTACTTSSQISRLRSSSAMSSSVEILELDRARPGSAALQRAKRRGTDQHDVLERDGPRPAPWHRRGAARGRTA